MICAFLALPCLFDHPQSLPFPSVFHFPLSTFYDIPFVRLWLVPLLPESFPGFDSPNSFAIRLSPPHLTLPPCPLAFLPHTLRQSCLPRQRIVKHTHINSLHTSCSSLSHLGERVVAGAGVWGSGLRPFLHTFFFASIYVLV